MLYLLHRDRTNDVGAMREMHIGGRQYYQVKRGLSLKILRNLLESNTCNLGNLIQSTTRDIIENANNNHRDMKDLMVQTEMNNLRAENQNLRFERSKANQNAYFGATVDAAVAELIRRTGHECPTPAYVVQPPQPVTFPTNCCGTANYAAYGQNNGCPCGC